MLIELLAFPFAQRALAAGAILGVLLAALGVLATLRKMAFFGEGVAHASLAGISIGILTNLAPLPVAIAWSVFIAVAIYYLERSTKLPSDTLIGILFTASMAVGVLLMSFTQGYQPELISFLFGNILSVTPIDLVIIAVASTLILAWFLPSLLQLTFLSLSEDSARVAGVNVSLQTLLFYIALAVATVLGVKILGIILVSALIVLPAAISRIWTRSFKSYFIWSIVFSEIIIILGLLLSYALDLPSGAVIILVGTALFLGSSLVRQIAKRVV